MTHVTREVEEIEKELAFLVAELKQSGDASRTANVMEKVEQTLTTLTAKHEADKEKARQEERGQTTLLAQQMLVEMMKEYNRDADKYGASLYPPPTIEDALQALSPTKTDNHQQS